MTNGPSWYDILGVDRSASPEQIYADCEDNGRLDSRYSDADLRERILREAAGGGS